MNSSNLMTARYAVIFTSQRTAEGDSAYAAMAERMEQLARAMPGFVDVESVRGTDGLGITVSYWTDLASIEAWRDEAEHRVAQSLGRSDWYAWYRLRICEIARESGFPPIS